MADPSVISMEPSQVPSLGVLAILPPEIRSMIWESLLPEYGSHRPTESPKDRSAMVWHNNYNPQTSFLRLSGRLAILHAHPRLYNEIFPTLHTGVLYITIQHDKYGWFFKDDQNSPRLRSDLPASNRFHTVHVDIVAHDKDDPGQLIQLRNKVQHFAFLFATKRSLFERCPSPYENARYLSQLRLNDHAPRQRVSTVHYDNMPEVRLHFTDQASSFWLRGATLVTWDGAMCNSDLRSMLGAFYFVKFSCKRKLQVTLQGKHQASNQDRSLSLDSGRALPTLESSSFHDLKREQTTDTIILDKLLDEMPGPTATYLRRERFRCWPLYEQALKKMEYLLPTNGREAWVTVPLQRRNEIRREIDAGHGELIWLSDKEDGRPAVLTDPWLKKYPEGIPPLASLEQLLRHGELNDGRWKNPAGSPRQRLYALLDERGTAPRAEHQEMGGDGPLDSLSSL